MAPRKAKRSKKSQRPNPPKPSVENEDEWEDGLEIPMRPDMTQEEAEENAIFAFEAVVTEAEKTNTLLKALLTHPKLNKDFPPSSPKQLFFVTDLVRKTYTNYYLTILPRNAVFKSSRLANPHITDYSDDHPCPPESQKGDDYLHDAENWALPTRKFMETFEDAIGRTQMACLLITDPSKGAKITGERFDWKSPVDIDAVARSILPSR